MNGSVLPEDVLRDAPSFTPRPYELADLELLLSGAYAPLTGFLGRADLASLARRGRLADGASWPVPVTCEIPGEVASALDPADPVRRTLVLTDPEGAPVAAIEVTDMWRTGENRFGIGGPVRRMGDGGHGPFQRLRRMPEEVRALLPPGRVLGVIADRPLHRPQLAQIAHAARTLAAHLLILIPVSGPGPDGLPPEALVRSIFAARDRMPPATVVAVPLLTRGDEMRDALLRARVARAYGVTHVLSTGDSLSGAGLRVLLPRELAYDNRDGQWRWRDDIPPRNRRLAMSPAEIDDLLDRGFPLPEWHTPPAVAKELSRVRPPRRQRGLVVFFTGLSGSGKSTIARNLADALRETGDRTVTLLDGDVVRRELTAGLGFSKADRDRNVRRIGWVAAEVGRHRGMAVACPIAPYEAARAAARKMAVEAGAGFILVHVATPLEVCESRDRKGLYARARAGQLRGMTGIDDPYEEPTDAELTVDTTTMTVPEAVEMVLGYLVESGWVEPKLS
ncbi:sulfate adenylyltransferase [Actinoplanes campanulatus]|uniref:adenylyl-sulfate kinase n=1 Tax=Actinoplanes campanulatus TaxID=113559 RepID=A0A7W5FGJ5_9ACTN|nr:adenylyl-sulfate kinase [Actinoplanes campanulatus]MBB3097542.1 sulfate adenylyltransferase [Actinoplanes campanulatus]GGN27511.1 sulfate adenylyltransferase [Actinoplanes campanulatus]GID37995.1 sulfate adenylyltransferase [Actinoplanes campanulatus]